MDIKDANLFGALLFTSGTFTASAGTTLDLSAATVHLPANAVNAANLDAFTAATPNAAGTKGAVPAPVASPNPAGMFLNAAGTFTVPGEGGSGIDPDIVDATSKSDDFNGTPLAAKWVRKFWPYSLQNTASLVRLTSMNYQPGGFVQEVESFGEAVELTGLLWQIVGKVRFTGGDLPPDGSSGGIIIFNAEAGTNNPGQPCVGLCLRTVAGAVHIVSEYSGVITDAPQDPGGFDVTLPGEDNAAWIWLKLDGYGRAYYSLDGSTYNFLGTLNYNAPVAGANGSGSVILAGGNITYAGFYTRAVTNTVAGVSLDCDLFYCELHSHSSLSEGSNFLQNPMTAAGDLIVGIAAGAPARLPAGTVGQVLTMVGGVPTWAAGSGSANDPTTTPGDLIFRKADGTLGRLGVGATGQVLAVAGGLPVWATLSGGGVVTPPAEGTPLAYASDGDVNGLFYALGVAAGNGNWINPGNTAKLALTASGQQYGNNNGQILCVSDRTTGVGLDCVIEGGTGGVGQWIQFDLGASATFTCNALSFQQRGAGNGNSGGAFDAVTQIILSGSNDNATFSNIAVVDTSAHLHMAEWTTAQFAESTPPYRYFRVTQTAVSANGGENRFGIGEIELYGHLQAS